MSDYRGDIETTLKQLHSTGPKLGNQ